MITRLKTRPRLDALDNQRRGAGKKLGRRIYFGILIGIGVALVYFFIGARFFLDADGLVMRDRFLLAAEYDSRLIENYIEPGDQIRKGQKLLLLDSRDIANKLSDYDARRAELLNQLEEVTALIDQAERLLPLARQQADAATEYGTRITGLFEKGYTTASARNDAVDRMLQKQRDVAALEGERISADKRRQTIQTTLKELESVIADTRNIFDDGVVDSPINGVVGPNVSAEGQVTKRGEPILQLFTGETYVVAFLPTNRAYSVQAGEKVTVSDGFRTELGRIDRVGGLTDNLPAEFQSTLKRRERQEIIRIVFDGDTNLTLGSTVSITSSFSISGLLARASAWISDDGTPDTMTTASVSDEEDAVGAMIRQERLRRPQASDLDQRIDGAFSKGPACPTCDATWQRLTADPTFRQRLVRTAPVQ